MFASKRKAESDPVEAVEFTPAKAKRTKQGATEFQDEKKGRWQQGMEELGAEFKKAMKEIPEDDIDRMNVVVGEYLRCRDQLTTLYDPPKGNVMAMGSDDSWALGVHNDPDADKRIEYPPTFVHSLPHNKIVQVRAGGIHSVALTESGEVYTWGNNDDKALGRPAGSQDSHTVRTITDFPAQAQGKIIATDAGDSHTVFLDLEGRVYMCGMYKDTDSGKFCNIKPGQKLKNGMQQPSPIEVSLPRPVFKVVAGGSWNAAILDDKSLYTWGMGHCGELARSKSMGAELVDAEANEIKYKTYNVGKTFIGEEFEEKVLDKKTNEMKTITSFRYLTDKITDLFLTPAPVEWSIPGKHKVLDVACGFAHILVLAKNEGEARTTVYSSGLSNYGQLGNGDTKPRHQLTPIKALDNLQIAQVSAGQFHSMARNSLGTALWAWGRSDYGQLGLFDEKEKAAGGFKSTPQRVPFPEEVGSIRISHIDTGENTSYAIFDNGNIYSWGFNTSMATGNRTPEGLAHDDIERATKLNVLRRYSKDKSKGSHAKTVDVSGGAQHALVLVQQFQ